MLHKRIDQDKLGNYCLYTIHRQFLGSTNIQRSLLIEMLLQHLQMVHNKYLVVERVVKVEVVEVVEAKVGAERDVVNLIYQIYTKDIVDL